MLANDFLKWLADDVCKKLDTVFFLLEQYFQHCLLWFMKLFAESVSKRFNTKQLNAF